jgi:hydroxymethylglutaryl-CoA lyase
MNAGTAPPMVPVLPDRITVREVGPRDGLQAEEPLPVPWRVAMATSLIDAGATSIEAAAFVSPKAVPAMAGGAEVIRGVREHLDSAREVTVYALVPNVRGAQMAAETRIDALTLTVSASEAYSQRNVHMSVDESLAQAGAIRAAVGDGLPIDTVVSCAFGSPYEGDIDPGSVASLGRRALEGGSTSVTYADTTGMATPRRVRDLLAETGTDVGLHLHDTRGTALVNAYAALQAGVTRFDTAVGGLGGSPFAEGAGGNLATEDLVHLCDDLGVTTGFDLDALLAISSQVAGAVGHAVPSRIAAAGPRWNT